jgi:Plasmid pRiA4b ORF-3-like protein
LGVVDITPSVVTSELAEAALASPALSRALELAAWVGDDKELTADGTLRPEVAAEACRALGIELPAERLRSAGDAPELAQVWAVARDAGFITVTGEHARGSGLDDVTTGAEAALRSWLRAFAPKLDLPEEPCGRCLTVLTELAGAADGVASTAELLDAVRSAFPTPGRPDDLASELRHAVSAVADLLSFAAAVPAVEEPQDDNRVRLTPLGRMLAESVFALLAVDPAVDAGAAVAMLAELPPAVSTVIVRPWLAARTPTGAARELLGFAESATARQRTVAVPLAKGIGPEAARAWREYAGVPGFGAYAREWLAALGAEVAADPRDEAWLTVESISAADVSMPPDVVSGMISSAAGRSDLSDLPTILTMLRESGHPDAERVVEAISKVVDPGPQRASARAPGGSVYQLKVLLRDVCEPPVWRRILVPAGTRLGRLASIIEVAMGWGGWHQHVFTDGGREFPETAALRGPLSKPGDRLGFTYDFGDGWEHDLELEDIIQNIPGVTLPACLGGGGACPPEDCGGPPGYALLKEAADGFGPAAFSVQEVTGRLSRLQAAPDAADSTGLATVVRIQPRAKKKKAKRKR